MTTINNTSAALNWPHGSTEVACSSCGLTMGESRLLADFKRGEVSITTPVTADVAADTERLTSELQKAKTLHFNYVYEVSRIAKQQDPICNFPETDEVRALIDNLIEQVLAAGAPTSEPVAVDRDAEPIATWVERMGIDINDEVWPHEAWPFMKAEILDLRARVAANRPAAQEVPAAPQGYKVVPLNATEAMMHAAEDVPSPRPYGAVYRAMLAAAPEVPAPAASDEGDFVSYTRKQLLEYIEYLRQADPAPQGAQAQPDAETRQRAICAIERAIDDQLLASGMSPREMYRQDGETVLDAVLEILRATSGNSTEQGEG